MIFGHFSAKMEVLFRGGQISKIWKIRALGSKCDPSLQDGLPGTENTQKSCKNEGRDYFFSGKKYFLPTAIVVIFSIIMIIIIIIINIRIIIMQALCLQALWLAEWPENQVPRNKDAARWRVLRAAHWLIKQNINTQKQTKTIRTLKNNEHLKKQLFIKNI